MKQKPESLIALGNRIKYIRTQKQFSQEQLAEACNFDRTYISLVERGLRNPSFTNLCKFAVGLGVSVSDLTSNQNHEDNEQ